MKNTRRRVLGCGAILLLLLAYFNCSSSIAVSRAKEHKTETLHDIYDKDDRLERTDHKSYKEDENPLGSDLYEQYMWISKSYDEEEIAKSSHAQFDEKNRILYTLRYDRFSLLYKRPSYCEEDIREWDDDAHTCRRLSYKSAGMSCRAGYCVANRYLFHVNQYQFSEDDRLLSMLEYTREVGSDRLGYSEELFFHHGYQAEYDGDRLMSELDCYDYWGTNEAGSWSYNVYQYDEQGRRSLKVVVWEDKILLYCYEYDTEPKRTNVYTYLVKEDWELACDDGSIYYFRPDWGKPAVKKVAADKTVEKRYYYGKTIDMGQQHYMLQEKIDETTDDHRYVVKPGDCLWDIARRHYGDSAYWELLWSQNRGVIGRDKNLILPGTRLFMPEVGNAQDTK